MARSTNAAGWIGVAMLSGLVLADCSDDLAVQTGGGLPDIPNAGTTLAHNRDTAP